MPGDDAILSVAYTGEPEIVHEFTGDRVRLQFGRDADACDIVIWSAINGRELSRIAGVIWRMEDQLWVRNLSHRHELYLQPLGQPVEQPLPPRRRDGIDRGAARTVPGPVCYVRGPGGCELLVRQRPTAIIEDPTAVLDEETSHMPPIPDALRPVAAALCEPLLAGSQIPATYAQIDARTNTGSLRRTRSLVAQLCSVFAAEIPTLAERVGRRMRRELAELELGHDPRLNGGIWRFESELPAFDESADAARRRAMALPDYFELAHLLVRRALVTDRDLLLLAEPSGPRP